MGNLYGKPVSEQDQPKRLKVILAGPDNAGKSTLLDMLAEGVLARDDDAPVANSRYWTHAAMEYIPTAGIDLTRITVSPEAVQRLLGRPILENYMVEIWDTPGRPQYRYAISRHYHSCDLVILVFNGNDPESWRSLLFSEPFHTESQDFDPNTPVLIVATKCDQTIDYERWEEFGSRDENAFVDPALEPTTSAATVPSSGATNTKLTTNISQLLALRDGKFGPILRVSAKTGENFFTLWKLMLGKLLDVPVELDAKAIYQDPLRQTPKYTKSATKT